MRIGNWELGIGNWLLWLAVLLVVGLVGSSAECDFSQMGVSIQTGKPGEITSFDYFSRIEAVGGVHIEAVNKPAKTSLVADSDKLTVIRFTDPKTKGTLQGLDSIKRAEFVGPVKMVYVAPKPVPDISGKMISEVMTKIEATADNAVFDGVTGIACLTGHVKIIQDDPSLFSAPAVMTGDKALINLKRAPGAEDYDFKIESITGPSKIEVVPKAEAVK